MIGKRLLMQAADDVMMNPQRDDREAGC